MSDDYRAQFLAIVSDQLTEIGRMLEAANALMKDLAKEIGNPDMGDDFALVGATIFYNDPEERCEVSYINYKLPEILNCEPVACETKTGTHEMRVHGEATPRVLQYQYLSAANCTHGSCCANRRSCKKVGFPGTTPELRCCKYYHC